MKKLLMLFVISMFGTAHAALKELEEDRKTIMALRKSPFLNSLRFFFKTSVRKQILASLGKHVKQKIGNSDSSNSPL